MSYDSIVVGAGPNGLAAAITLAQQGHKVLLREAASTIGGGTRSAELTLPGYTHDVCSAIHPMGLASPFFRSLPLDNFGLKFIQPEIALAHPLPDGTAVAMYQSLQATAESIGADGRMYEQLMGPLVNDWQKILHEFLGPLRFPRHPIAMTRFGLLALWPAKLLAETFFKGERARALFGGLAAHAIQPLENVPTAAFGLMLGMLGHAVGWPVAAGGSQSIADALAAYLRSLGGEISTNARVDSLEQVSDARTVLFDLTPRQLACVAGSEMTDWYRNQLGRYRYGPGVFKMDFALREPIPWKAAECRKAGTVHLGGTLPELCASEHAMAHGQHAERPYVLLAQQTIADPSRAPAGRHTAWAYCHVPSGSTVDMSDRILAQMERFAPGVRDCILATSTRNASAYEAYNPNYVGGDINGGVQDLLQLFTRPTFQLPPYVIPTRTQRKLYICSSATPPGGAVHGMCGYFAAQTALRELAR
jgi:phytoene dehydrogenase-like protein